MDKLKEKVMAQARDGKITCKEAFEIAESMGVKPLTVGKLLNELNIKIRQCQLGCFK